MQGPGSIELSRLAVEASRRAMRSARQRVNFVLRPPLAALRRGSAWAGRGHNDGAHQRPRARRFPSAAKACLARAGQDPRASAFPEAAWNPHHGAEGVGLGGESSPRSPRHARGVAVCRAVSVRGGGELSQGRVVLLPQRQWVVIDPSRRRSACSFACRHVGLGQGPELERSRWT